MSTICFKDGMLAADTMVTSQGTFTGCSEKVFSIGDDSFAVAGELADVARMQKWKGPDSVKDLGLSENSNVFWVDAKGVLREIERDCILPIIEAEFHATGSGREFAMGAMASGASAPDAVLIASRYDLATNDDVTVIDCNG